MTEKLPKKYQIRTKKSILLQQLLRQFRMLLPLRHKRYRTCEKWSGEVIERISCVRTIRAASDQKYFCNINKWGSTIFVE